MAEFKEKKYLEDIKSSYIIKQIFLYLKEEQKFNLVTYNKQLQKKIGIDIEDYKTISGKYKIGERNGKGKEYDIYNDEIIFEGEYINGERNGKGKEYNGYSGKLKYEGEYINGERNGKGKEYYNDDKLKFEGEYLNGEKWNGKGKEYDWGGQLEFDGEYLNGNKIIN